MASRGNPNPKGSKPEKIWRAAIMRAVNRAQEGCKTKHLETLADKVVAMGLKGDMSAIEEIGNRLDGKPTQGIDLAPTAEGLEALLARIGSSSRSS